jgi:hypothetical protein
MNVAVVYREVLSGGRRTFELFDDRIELRVRYPNQTADLTFQLSTLRPTPNCIRVREKPFTLGCLLIVIPLLLVAAHWGIYGRPLEWMIYLAVGGGTAGAVMCLYCLRKIEFASFVNHTGNFAFDVGDSGPDRSNFRAFVDEVTKNISDVQRH